MHEPDRHFVLCIDVIFVAVPPPLRSSVIVRKGVIVADIFVSYAKGDKEKVIRLVCLFESQGWHVFWDPTLLPGHQWDKTLSAELEAAKCVVVAWSKAAAESHWVREEASRGRDRKILVPVSLDGTTSPFGFGLIQAENLADWRGDTSHPSVGRLLTGIRTVLDGTIAVVAAPQADRRPAEAQGVRWIPLAVGALVVLAATIAGTVFFYGTAPSGIGDRSAAQNTGSPATLREREAAAPGSDNLDAALLILGRQLQPAQGRVHVGIQGGDRILLGQEIAIEAEANLSGRLVIFDVNAARDVTQIFPNKYVDRALNFVVKAGSKIVIPGPGYGFTGFKAVEPTGHGTLIALLVPESSKVGVLQEDWQRLTKGFQPVNSPAKFIEELHKQIAAELPIGDGSDKNLNGWGWGLSTYEIVK